MVNETLTRAGVDQMMEELKNEVAEMREVLSTLLIKPGSTAKSMTLTGLVTNAWTTVTMPKTGLLEMLFGVGYWQVYNLRTMERFAGFGQNDQNVDIANLFVRQGDVIRYYAAQKIAGNIYYA